MYYLLTFKIVLFRKYIFLRSEAAIRGVLGKKVFFEISQNSDENTCTRVSFLIKLQASGLQLIKKETLAQVFSCKFCEISKKTFFTEHLWTTASGSTDLLGVHWYLKFHFDISLEPIVFKSLHFAHCNLTEH